MTRRGPKTKSAPTTTKYAYINHVLLHQQFPIINKYTDYWAVVILSFDFVDDQLWLNRSACLFVVSIEGSTSTECVSVIFISSLLSLTVFSNSQNLSIGLFFIVCVEDISCKLPHHMRAKHNVWLFDCSWVCNAQYSIIVTIHEEKMKRKILNQLEETKKKNKQ